MSAKAAFLGLGVMGYPMAGHMQRAGFDVTAYNRTSVRAEAWASEYGGHTAVTPRQAAHGADLVFACVGNDEDVCAIALGADGAFAGMEKGAVFIDHTTASAGLARDLAERAEGQGLGFVDAPVSGGQAGAQNGQLTVMAGGTQAAFEAARPAMETYAKKVKLMGPAGSGQLTKMVNQLCIAGVVQGLAEGLHFAKKAGLDPMEVVEAISKGAAQSWQMDNRAQTMTDGEYEFGFAVNWMRKDLAICLEEARRNGAHLPLGALVDQFYSEVQAMGGGRWDTSSLIARLEAVGKGGKGG